jgi:hypothetical protein
MATHGPLLAPSTGFADTELLLPYLPGYNRREVSLSLAAKEESFPSSSSLVCPYCFAV